MFLHMLIYKKGEGNMKEIKYVVTDPLGIHARPAGLIVKMAAGFKSAITIDNGAKKADAKRIMAVMSMGIKQGQESLVTVDGEDEEAAAAAIETFLKENV